MKNIICHLVEAFLEFLTTAIRSASDLAMGNPCTACRVAARWVVWLGSASGGPADGVLT